MRSRDPLHKGPFTGRDVEAVLRSLSFRLENPRGGPSEYRLYVDPRGGRRVPVNPSWSGIRAGDPIFNCLRRDLGIGTTRLLQLLDQARHDR